MSEAAKSGLAAGLGSRGSTSDGWQEGEMPTRGMEHASEDELLHEAEFRRRAAETEVDDVVAEIELVRGRMEQRARSFAAKLGLPAGAPSGGQVAAPAPARRQREAPSRSEKGGQYHVPPVAPPCAPPAPPARHVAAGELAGAVDAVAPSRTRYYAESQQGGMPPDAAFMESINFCRDVSLGPALGTQ